MQGNRRKLPPKCLLCKPTKASLEADSGTEGAGRQAVGGPSGPQLISRENHHKMTWCASQVTTNAHNSTEAPTAQSNVAESKDLPSQ